jgi:eukaryotic-like serine/threonine-protein kinase
MTPARFQTIEEIYRAALDQEPEQVSAFLDKACEGDAALRHKVEALLSSRQRADGFIESSAVSLAAKLIQNGHGQSLVGYTIGHYKICESIGAGGMGEVYVATDTVAGRKAALKLLPLRFTGDAERLKRFEQEARAVVALNHPNILTVYEIGADHSIHYIASELIEGETLRDRLTRGPMQLSEAVEIAIQVASALAAAHQAGIVHRDIKPENIMLRSDGYVKVLDFGIAKLAEEELPATMPKDEALLLVETNLGAVLGTVRYMSPEQARGGHVGKTTDIWSLGVVLYEMVIGHAPFSGDSPKEVMSSILEKEPPPLTRSVAHSRPELQQIISKTLRKDREERYNSAHELLQALKDLRRKLEAELERAAAPLWLRWARSPVALALIVLAAALALTVPFFRHRNLATTLPPDKSIAVLPLQNLSDDKQNAFFADGMQDELLSNLSKIKDLKVISRTSVMQYKSGTKRNLKEIAQQLGVSNVVEGSVRRSGDHVRVSVQLIDARTDRHLWGENYDRTLADSLSLQGELATDIASAVGATLSPQEKARVQAKPTNNPAAYDAYLRARAIPIDWGFALEGDIESAIRLYQEAVKLDPNFTLAWAYLSIAQKQSVWKQIGEHTALAGPAELSQAKDSLNHALALDANLPEVHLARGYNETDHARALAEFRQAEKDLPNSADVIEAIARAQRALGHWDEAVANLRRAIELDPRNIRASNNLALTYCAMRRFSEALATLDRILAWDPTNTRALLTKADALVAIGDLQAAEPLLANPELPASRRARYAVLQRNYAAATEILSKDLAVERGQRDPGDILSLAFSQQLVGDSSAARATYERAEQDFQRQLKQIAPGSFAEADTHALLGSAYAGLGDAASAIAEGQKAMALLPSFKNPEFGPDFENEMTCIYGQLGDADHAIPMLKRLLRTSCAGATFTTPATLRLDPTWDKIRNDPRFQELIAENAPIPEKSIAVLPFENLSKDKANAYLAAGIQEEILTRLASIADLKVISRSSTQRYQSEPRNIGEIANQLSVANILEGSVQKVADQVRVNVQLINAQTDSHLWAETYDRKLNDVLGVESEIAKRIAESLQAKLTGPEEQGLEIKPTNNPEAYEAYLRGLAFEARGRYSALLSASREAADSYERAVQFDPNFALAWARLCRVDSQIYFSRLDASSVARTNAAKRALENAQKLEPNSPETQLALGYYQYFVLGDYGPAKATFGRVSKMLRGSNEVPGALGYIERREGHWDESVAYFVQALALDPRNVELLMAAAWNYSMLRQFPAALKFYDRALDITPYDPDIMAWKAGIYQADGNLQEAARLLSKINEQTPNENTLNTKITQLRLERNYGEAVRLLQARLAEFQFDSQYWKSFDQVALALMQRLAGDTAGAKATAEQARNALEQLYKDQTDEQTLAGTLYQLSRAYALIGERDSALKAAQRVIMFLPRAKYPMDGPKLEENLAFIQTIVGENGRAISTLTPLLQTPYNSGLYGPGITPALLKLDPIWDPLRADPRFQELADESKKPVMPK